MSQVENVIPVMIGTAGHVDHGKTSLVRRLTGFDTDRLKEEKERGMSIDFGVAPFELPGVGRLGLIDVPGHEDFIRNMASGAASIDVLLLVVAADDAVMPQTIEHLRIAKLLGVKRVMAAITKIDLVDPELIELVKEDVETFLDASGFSDAPVVLVSNLTGEGVDDVRAALIGLVQTVARSHDARAFRMYVRHAFSMKGRGTVVTGVPSSGVLPVGATVELLPGGKRSGVRALQNYRHESEHTGAHMSSAVNLRDLAPEELQRGMVLAEPGVFRATDSAIVSIQNTHETFRLKRRCELRMLTGTAKAVCRIALIDKDGLAPGETGFARVRFQESLVVAAGDRFIVRGLSPAVTIGGGLVLSIRAGRVRRRDQPLVVRLGQAHKALLEREDVFESELHAGTGAVVRLDEIATLAQCGAGEARTAVEACVTSGMLRPLGADAWIIQERSDELVSWLHRSLSRYHRANKFSIGMKPTYAAELAGLAPSSAPDLVALLTQHPDIVQRHGSLALKEFKPQISAREAKLREDTLRIVVAAGAQSVAKGDLQQELQMTPTELKLVIKLLSEENLLAVVGGNLVDAKVIEGIRAQLIDLFSRMTVVDLKTFRDKTGMSRNFGVALLEHFDSEGMTKRSGDGRVLLQTWRTK
ncbi:MAG: selenocysteine-specific translation elongation factor [Bdellovibrionales bacterium]|nr:selenocysteine-specific translation elongation factor [Bdellovibrionales bacterium]